MKGNKRIVLAGWFLLIGINLISLWNRMVILEQEQDEFRMLKLTKEYSSEGLSLLENDLINKSSTSGGEQALQYEALIQKNPDFAGWINIPGTSIDYPVMQSASDREYYLHRNFNRENSYSGIPFVGEGDLNTEGDVSIYGHNMKNGTMFADLLKYREQKYSKNHPVIELETLRGSREYAVVYAFYATEQDWMDQSGIFQMPNRTKFICEMESRSLYNISREITEKDKFIFLITCSYQEDNGRFVVVGVLK